jgi:3-oxoacyl-[acyl-carrier protein] reductase
MNKVVLITGGTKGLGKTMSINLAQNGWNIIATFKHDDDAAQELREKLKDFEGNHHVIKSDISSKSETEELFKFIMSEFGHITALINNTCASFQLNHFLKLSLEDFENQLNITFKGALYANYFAAKLMQKAKQGTIVNILTNTISESHATGFSHYLSAKYALFGLSRSLRSELQKFHIGVHNIFPGLMDTPLTKSWPESLVHMLLSNGSQKEFTDKQVVAGLVLDLLESSPEKGKDVYC